MFRGGPARYTITLNPGVLLFGTDVYLIHGVPIDAAVDLIPFASTLKSEPVAIMRAPCCTRQNP